MVKFSLRNSFIRLIYCQGPIVRITPFEVHISDPNYVNELYSMRVKVDKDPWYYSWLDRNGSGFATVDSDLHKIRSMPIKKGLSSASIGRVEGMIKEHMSRFIRCMAKARDARQPINMENIYRSFAIDVVSDIALPQSMAFLDTPDYGATYHEYTRNFVVYVAIWNRHFPLIASLLNALPRWVFALQGKTALSIFDSMASIKQQATKVIQNDGKPISNKSIPVIMNEVYRSDEIPPSEKTQKRLFEEITILIGAGSETTGTTLLTITYHVLANPSILQTLRAEIEQHFTEAERSEILGYKQLESLPYLTAIITEGIRLSSSVSGRLPRINRVNPMIYTSPLPNAKSYTLPPGSVISMSYREMHHHPESFPSPSTFDPERFLGDRKAASMKSFIGFGRGARSCVGQALAWAEMYMVVGNLFSKFEVRLAEGVGVEDVLMEFEGFSPFIAEGRKGVWLEVGR